MSYGLNTNVLTIFEENNYYPFGLKHKGYNDYTPTSNKYKFNGKELQDELGLNVYDYDNRVYDPATGRFLQMDPLGEQGRRWSPYNYCFDNPVYFQDPDGMWPWPTWSQVKSFAKGYGNTLVGMAKGMANDIKLSSGPLGPMGKILDVSSRVAPSLMKGDFKGTAKAMLNESGLPALANTTKKAIKGDAGAIGSLAAIATVAVVAERVGVPGAAAEGGEASVASRLQGAASEASATVGEGSGAVHGTKVHTEFGKLAGEIEGVSTEVSYKNGQVVPYGTKGSVRADAVWGDVNAPSAIFDLKTGGAKLTPKNVAKYNEHVPGTPPVKEIKP